MNYFKYQLYLLQIENYEIDRFWRLLFAKGYFKSSTPLRKSLVWTKKALLILVLSIILIIISAYLCLNVALWLAVIWVIVSLLLMPLYYSLMVYLLLPFDFMAKKSIIDKATKLVAAKKDIKIIGIAGSYGKTTLKNILYSVLSQKYKVMMPSGNTNTAMGLSKWVLKHSTLKADILLVEFGEEYPGDNYKIAQIFPQDITVITGINEAHLERMGSLDKSAAAIFESVSSLSDEAAIYLNLGDENVKKYYSEHTGNHKIIGYGDAGLEDIGYKNKRFDVEKMKWNAEMDTVGNFSVKFLASYVFADIAVAASIAKRFDISNEKIITGIAEASPVEHRLQPIINAQNDLLVIDDSYNGNPEGVAYAVKTLALFKNKRKIYLTPGLVETGARSAEVHQKIGEQLSSVADKVILIKNSVTPHIAKGLRESGYKDEDIIWFDSTTEAHEALGGILKSGDVILFQNDWGDQYM